MPTDVELVKSRLDLVEVIGEYVKLRPAGQNWKGLCPFHGEKSPSFMVHREKQLWHCFGCGLGGDVLEFVQRLENMEFPEVLEVLARRAGVELTRRSPGEANQRQRLFDVLSAAAGFYRSQLAAPAGAIAQAYLTARAVTAAAVATFGIGYAPPEWDLGTTHLVKQGFTWDELTAAGLAVRSDRGPGVYDRFRNRLIFPIADVQGRVVGFGGRTLGNDPREAKYINSPQSAVYSKGFVVYNLDRAKAAIKEAGYAVMVEGYMDVVGSHQAGVVNVVATSGTALTPDQVKLLKRYTNEIRIAFDADLAGQSASERGINLALGAELEVKVITIPQGKDPDECAREDPATWLAAVAAAEAIGDYAFRNVLAHVDVREREGKKEAARKLLSAIAKLPDPVERDFYLKRLSRELDVDERSLRERLPAAAAGLQPAPVGTPEPTVPTQPANRVRQATQSLLALVLKYPGLMADLAQGLEPTLVPDIDLRQLYSRLLVYYTESHHADPDELALELADQPALVQLLAVLQLRADDAYAEVPLDAAQRELAGLVRELKYTHLKAELRELAVAIGSTDKDSSNFGPLAERYNECLRELDKLK